nr:MAG TPA: hypothetical protein [Caudoviricetes sp.]
MTSWRFSIMLLTLLARDLACGVLEMVLQYGK